jgi:hypothetical protein
MASPSPLQLFVLIVCGAALATFSCFQVSGSEIDAGSIGLMLGILIIGYVAVRLFVRPSSAPASAPEPASAPSPLAPAPSGPTVRQALALVGSAVLLFFFSCSGALLGSFTSNSESLMVMVGVGLAGMLAGTVFTIGGVIRLIKSVARAMRQQ